MGRAALGAIFETIGYSARAHPAAPSATGNPTMQKVSCG